MKTINLIGSAALVAGLLAASSAQATLVETLTFNDDGSASGSPDSLTYSAIQSDDSAGIGSVPATDISALDYVVTLPLPLTGGYPLRGWVAIYGPGSSDTGDPLKLIHFDNSNGNYNNGDSQQMFFYSDVNDGSLAYDYGHSLWSSANSTEMSDILASAVKINETVVGANYIAYYTPNSTQAGYVQGGNGNTIAYDFVEPVPEVSTIIAGALLVLPFGASTLRILRRRWMA